MLNKKLLSAAVQASVGPSTDPDFKQTVLLLHGDGTNGAQNNTFIDGSSNNFTVTRNGNTTQGTFTPFSQPDGAWSNFFDGSGDALTIADNAAFDLSSGDFTVETWVNFSALPAASAAASFISQWPSGSRGWFFYLFNSAGTYQLYLTYSTNGSNQTNLSVNLSAAPAVGTWNHLVFVRSGNDFLVFWNGTQVGSTQTLSATIFNSTGSIVVGGQIESGSTISSPLNGYLSNLRLVKGTAVYTAAFTPSTTPLTAITNTSLLTCQSNRFVDNSSNNFAITRNGDVRVTAFSPFAPTAAYDAGTNGGSGYFDGSGDYLTVADNNAFEFGSGDFTIEGWVYLTGGSSAFRAIVGKGNRDNASGESSFIVHISNTNKLQMLFDAGSSNGFWSVDVQGTTDVVLNAWHHFAIVRNGNVFTAYLNGSSEVTTTNSLTLNDNAQVLSVGALGYTGGTFINPLTGYISNLRLVKGSAVYTAAFTPPTAPLTAITNTSLLLNFTNGGIIDSTGKNVLETVGDAQIDTTTKKYGTGSMEFDGTGDCLVAPNSPDLTFGTGDFTIEFWLYLNSTASDQVIFDTRPASTQGVYPVLYFSDSNDTLRWFISSFDRIESGALSAGTWYHVAIARSGTSTKMFVNGTQAGNTYSDSNNYLLSRFVLGASSFSLGSTGLNGFIDDLRITKGIARYTTTFTPPTAPFEDQ